MTEVYMIVTRDKYHLPRWRGLTAAELARLEEDATLGSLFDGIAGFPLIWERIHGKGTARWASEIEEFPGEE